MFRLLEDSATQTSNGYGTYILLGVFLVLMLVLMFVNKKKTAKEQETRTEMENTFKKGTKILTSFGVYGEIVEITETTDGKVVLIATGDNGKQTYMNVHINAIMNVDKKQPIVYDANGNDITNYDALKESSDLKNTDVNNNKKSNEENKNNEVKEDKETLNTFDAKQDENNELENKKDNSIDFELESKEFEKSIEKEKKSKK